MYFTENYSCVAFRSAALCRLRSFARSFSSSVRKLCSLSDFSKKIPCFLSTLSSKSKTDQPDAHIVFFICLNCLRRINPLHLFLHVPPSCKLIPQRNCTFCFHRNPLKTILSATNSNQSNVLFFFKISITLFISASFFLLIISQSDFHSCAALLYRQPASKKDTVYYES